MSKWKKVVLTLVGLAVACTTIGVMTGNAFAAPPVIVLDPGHSGTSVTTIDPETQIMDKEYPNMPEMQDVLRWPPSSRRNWRRPGTPCS